MDLSKERQPSDIIAVFDFCETIVNFQTADSFVIFTANKYGITRCFLQKSLQKFLYKTKMVSSLKNKQWILRTIQGLTVDELDKAAEEFLETMIFPNLNLALIEKLAWHKRMGHTLVLASGGYAPYLRKFAEKFGINHVVGVELEIHNQRLTGRISGLNCMGTNKVKKLSSSLDLGIFNLRESFCYTDHPSDMPLIQLMGHSTIVVSSKTKHRWDPHPGMRFLEL